MLRVFQKRDKWLVAQHPTSFMSAHAIEENFTLLYLDSRSSLLALLQVEMIAILTHKGNNRKVVRLMQGKSMPNGVALQGSDLIVAEIGTMWRIANVDQQVLAAVGKGTILGSGVEDISSQITSTMLTDEFPKESHHGWKYIAFGPDGRLYTTVGAPCNVCRRNDSRFATLMRQKSPGEWSFEVYASGIRNSVGFDWHPDTGDMWFTENGRDFHGYNFPPGM